MLNYKCSRTSMKWLTCFTFDKDHILNSKLIKLSTTSYIIREKKKLKMHVSHQQIRELNFKIKASYWPIEKPKCVFNKYYLIFRIVIENAYKYMCQNCKKKNSKKEEVIFENLMVNFKIKVNSIT